MTPVETVNPSETPVLQEPMPAEATQVEHDPAEVTGQVEENLAEVTAQVDENPAEVPGQLEDDAAALPPQVILPQTSGSSMDTSSILLDAGIEVGLVNPLEGGLSQQPRMCARIYNWRHGCFTDADVVGLRRCRAEH